MKMKAKIAKTFFIMLIIGFFLGGINNIVIDGKSFFNIKTLGFAVLGAFSYLFFLWTNTRKHKELIIVIAFIIIIVCPLIWGIVTKTITYTAKEETIIQLIIRLINYNYYMAIYGFSYKHSRKLMEE